MMTISEEVRPIATWAPCRPGQPEEDGGERAVAGVEADVRVLEDLGEQEREAHDERQHQPGEERRRGCRA